MTTLDIWAGGFAFYRHSARVVLASVKTRWPARMPRMITARAHHLGILWFKGEKLPTMILRKSQRPFAGCSMVNVFVTCKTELPGGIFIG